MLIYLLFLTLPLSIQSLGTPCLDHDNQLITTCTRCLSRPECTWCSAQLAPGQPAIGCIEKGSYDCSRSQVKSNPTSRLIKALPLGQEPRVQLTPQDMRVTMSPNHPFNVNLEVSLSDVPVDIYFVMDHSNSMKIHKTNLVSIGL